MEAIVARYFVLKVVTFLFLALTAMRGTCAEESVEDQFAAVSKAAEAGNTDAQSVLCAYWMQFDVLGKRPPNIVDWCEVAVEKGDIEAVSNYATALELGFTSSGVQQNVKKAVELYKWAAEKGDEWSHNKLGEHYATGEYLAKDDGKSCFHYEKASGRYPRSQEMLGSCYDEGAPGYPKDVKKAVQLYEKAITGRYVANWAHYRLGYLYYFGEGVEKNSRAAARVLSKGANQKYGQLPSPGFYILGLIFENGDGEAKNDDEAFKYFMRGAERNHAASQNTVGTKYAEGKGVAKDMVKALMWFTISAANGYKNAADNRDKAETLLKPAEVKRAQKQAKEWLDRKSKE